jgi:cell division septation protein DedD
MNRLLDDQADSPGRGYAGQRRASAYDPAPEEEPDREISLGTPTILGIFFALAIALAAAFGVGYSMGRKSAQSATAAALTDTPLGSSAGPAKPAAGSVFGPPAAQPHNDIPASPPVVVEPAAPAAPPAAPKGAINPTVNPSDRIIAGEKPATSAPQPAPAALPPATGNQQPATSYLVQIAAVSHQEDADTLVAELQKKGYNVAVHHEPQDKLLHVQIGPFTDRKEADAMRARVLADGFNAIVK